ncbi:TPA: excinuclease ABC subunit A [Candidatus Uhrbacteria bacterium]|nr:excinuclease ABC subunit A [Candidatus Uhrbacteria bacterium]
MQDKITIKGAREHNLKNIDVEIPRNKITCITGVSGSGKSSLAFDTIFAEGQRRYVESLSAYARQFLGQMQKPDVDEIEGLSPAISIDQKAHSANPRSTVATITEIYDYMRVLFARIGKPHCIVCNREIQKMTVDEMCGLVNSAISKILQPTKHKRGLQDDKKSKITILAPVVRGRKGEYYQLLYDLYNSGFAKVRIDGKEHDLSDKIILDRYKQHTIELVVDTIPLVLNQSDVKAWSARLSEALEIAIAQANGVVLISYPDGTEQTLSSKFSCPDDGFAFPEIEPRLFSFNSPYGACAECHGIGTEDLYSTKVCKSCSGARLRREALNVFINQKNIVDITSLSIDNAIDYFLNLKLSETEKQISEPIMNEIMSRLQFMLDVGLHYLTLERKAGTLSGGEAQRIRLASQIGSRLVGALYVLDEPTIGLHQKDNEKLINTLVELRNLGNTVVVVEHDEDMIRRSDYMVELGPGAGEHGGKVTASGPVPDVFKTKDSITGAYMRGEASIPVPKNRRDIGKDSIRIIGAKENNLKNLDVEIPLRRFVCVTGVSGSGKSTLINDILYSDLASKFYGASYPAGKHKAILGAEYIDRVQMIDQSPIGRTPRSNPATYIGVWSEIRELFSATEEARYRGYKPSRFSFNVPSAIVEPRRGGGRCENCEGHGVIAIEMHFLPTVYIACDVCNGKRFDSETLEVEWKEKNIHDILQMTVEEASVFFKDIPQVYDRLKTMNEVGLGYVRLGQGAPTLSGGEAQRVKLASELSKRQSGRTLYLLDEPTVGLHVHDVKRLLEVLHTLVNRGNSVVIIEHNLDIIKTADWVIDLGPEGGDKGGEIVAVGTPEDIARKSKSFTGQYLKKVL